ncbi:sensor histidine kinase [Cellulomonas palmilytica]|uniref:sensor histidine kinase n=1 Tax=Cellulomonas palmilytica TaxID=2608402 RepID=UPI001F2BE8DA|nr:HAMP domain-containing sensor histidine kinase [Cellulomonas palmilytica]UJP40184.1 HAMP domain-containing histidine kinase [Cellulomonas palmilytica]
MRGLSVRWRLTVAYTAITAVSAAALLALVYLLVLRSQRRSVHVESTLVAPSDAPLPAAPGLGAVTKEIRDQAVGSALDDLVRQSLVGLVVITVVSVGVGWLVAGRVLRPVHTITTRARDISTDRLDERIALDGPHDELRALADTFDDLLGRVQTTVTQERRLVATMSHELRTPLANQQAALDVALADPDADADELRAAARTALDQSRRAARTVDALLDLARAQAGGAAPDPVPVDLRAVTADAVAQVRGDDDELRWDVRLDEAVVPGHPELVARAVVNLVHNAARHNVVGGFVEVSVTASPGGALVVVANSGPDVPDEAAADLTLPFRRGARDRTVADDGVGLGLTLVQAVADQHGGALRLRPREGGGLVAELELPPA